MPERHMHSCNSGGCPNAAPAGQSYCDRCLAMRKQTPTARGSAPPRAIQKLYDSAQWRKPGTGTAALVRGKNPICQYLDDNGVQCQHASAIVHHLVDPKDNAALFFDWKNLVAVCAAHHQGGQRGETQEYKYCHTIGFGGAVFSRGFMFPVWHEQYVTPRANLVQVSSTAFDAARIAAALAEPL
jgi:hypothetical protein